jgi:superfamily II DNA/RNA helicase
VSSNIKNQQEILQKMGIEKLNPMQEAAQAAIHAHAEVMLLSPTGSGKTLGFALPIIQQLDMDKEGVQALVLVPSRELALQIEQVITKHGHRLQNQRSLWRPAHC